MVLLVPAVPANKTDLPQDICSFPVMSLCDWQPVTQRMVSTQESCLPVTTVLHKMLSASWKGSGAQQVRRVGSANTRGNPDILGIFPKTWRFERISCSLMVLFVFSSSNLTGNLASPSWMRFNHYVPPISSLIGTDQRWVLPPWFHIVGWHAANLDKLRERYNPVMKCNPNTTNTLYHSRQLDVIQRDCVCLGNI